MSQADSALFEPIVEPWARGDFSAWLRMLAPDVVLSGYMPEGVVTYEGRDDVRRYLADFSSMWMTYRVEVESVTSPSDSVVLISGRQVGIGSVSGLEIAEPVHVVNRLRAVEIAESHWHVDREEALRAAGLAGSGAD